MTKERNYGIDLLRLVLMFMVCLLHTLGQGGILRSSIAGTWHYKIFWLIEIIAYCAVDGFALISGYTASDKPRKYAKLVEMWFQVFFYAFIVTFIFTLLGKYEWSTIDMIKCALPVTFNKFWYFTSFFGLFFAIPILNKFIFSIDEKTAKTTFIIIIILFSIINLLKDPFILNSGYSMIWLIILYLIGALAKKIKLFETRKSLTLIILWALCILVTWLTHSWLGEGRLVNYISPTILMSGIIMVILFSRLHLKGTIISKLSPLAFGIYLFQLNQVVWTKIIYNTVAFITSKSILIGIACIFTYALFIFLSGLLVEFFRSKIAKILHVSSISQKIVDIINILIQKLFIFLK